MKGGPYETGNHAWCIFLMSQGSLGISMLFTWTSHWFLPADQSSDKFFNARQISPPLAVITPKYHEALPVSVTSQHNMVISMDPHTCKDVSPSLSLFTISSSSLEVWSIALCFKNKFSISSFYMEGFLQGSFPIGQEEIPPTLTEPVKLLIHHRPLLAGPSLQLPVSE